MQKEKMNHVAGQMQIPVIERSVLTVAGSDSSGGAGIQADMNTFAAFGVYGASIITAVTARNTLGIQAVEPVSDLMIIAQLKSVLEDLPICAVKTGMLPSVAGISILGEMLAVQEPNIPLVVDPVVIEPKGKKLTGETALEAIQNHLFPLATLITPNREEAEVMTGMTITTMDDMEAAAGELLGRGSHAVFLKGGRLKSDQITDILMTRDNLYTFKHPAQKGRYHGTGCTLSSAVAAGLALGQPLPEAVKNAVDYVQDCLVNSVAPLKGRLGLLGHKARG